MTRTSPVPSRTVRVESATLLHDQVRQSKKLVHETNRDDIPYHKARVTATELLIEEIEGDGIDEQSLYDRMEDLRHRLENQGDGDVDELSQPRTAARAEYDALQQVAQQYFHVGADRVFS